MFTFRCPKCKKQHDIYDSFTEPLETRCFRCQTPIRLTRRNVRISPDSEGAARPSLPSGGLALAAPARPATTPRTPPIAVKAAAGAKKRRGRKALLVGGLVTAGLLSLGASAYFVFGRGEAPETNIPAHDAAPRKAPDARASQQRPSAPNGPAEQRLRAPLDVAREAIERRFGKKVVVTAVRIEDGNLTLEGELDRWEDLRPAREVAIRTLEEAGFGPIRSWDNHLKKPKK